MARRKLKATTAAVTAAGAILLTFGTGTAQAAQVGNDRSGGFGGQHTWIKVGKTEFGKRSGMSVCTSSGLSAYNCGFLGGTLDSARKKNPNASGYWAEFYYNTGKNRGGTW